VTLLLKSAKVRQPAVVKIVAPHLVADEYFTAGALPAFRRRTNNFMLQGKPFDTVWLVHPDKLVASGAVSVGLITNARADVDKVGGKFVLPSEADLVSDIIAQVAAKQEAAGHVHVATELRDTAEAERAENATEAKPSKLVLTTKQGLKEQKAEKEALLGAQARSKSEADTRVTATLEEEKGKVMSSPDHHVGEAKDPLINLSEAQRKAWDKMHAHVEHLRESGGLIPLTKHEVLAKLINGGRLENITVQPDSTGPIQSADVKEPMTSILEAGKAYLVGTLVPTPDDYTPSWRGRPYSDAEKAKGLLPPFLVVLNKNAQAQLYKEYGPWIRKLVRGYLKKYEIPNSMREIEAVDLERDAYVWLQDLAKKYQPTEDGFATAADHLISGVLNKRVHAMRRELKSRVAMDDGGEGELITDSELAGDETGVDEAARTGRFSSPEEAVSDMELSEIVARALLPGEQTLEDVDRFLSQGRIQSAFVAVECMTPTQVDSEYQRSAKTHADALRAFSDVAAEFEMAKLEAQAAGTTYHLTGGLRARYKAAFEAEADARGEFEAEERRKMALHRIVAAQRKDPPDIKVIRDILHSETRRTRLTQDEAFAFTALLNLDDESERKDKRIAIEIPDAKRGPDDLPVPRFDKRQPRMYLNGARTLKETAELAVTHGIGSFREWLKDAPTHYRNAVAKLELMPREVRLAVSTALTGLSAAASGARSEFTADTGAGGYRKVMSEDGKTFKMVPVAEAGERGSVQTVQYPSAKKQAAMRAELETALTKIRTRISTYSTKHRAEISSLKLLERKHIETALSNPRQLAALLKKKSNKKVAERLKDLRYRAATSLPRGLRSLPVDPDDARETLTEAYTNAEVDRINKQRRAVGKPPLTDYADWSPVQLRHAAAIISDARFKAIDKYHELVTMATEDFHRHYGTTKKGRIHLSRIQRMGQLLRSDKRAEGRLSSDLAKVKLGPELAAEAERRTTVQPPLKHAAPLSVYDRFLTEVYGSAEHKKRRPTVKELHEWHDVHSAAVKKLGRGMSPEDAKKLESRAATGMLEAAIEAKSPDLEEFALLPPPAAAPALPEAVEVPEAATPAATPVRPARHVPDVAGVAAKVLARQAKLLTADKKEGQEALARMAKRKRGSTRKGFREIALHAFQEMIDLRKAMET
jgi:hypothetical protein